MFKSARRNQVALLLCLIPMLAVTAGLIWQVPTFRGVIHFDHSSGDLAWETGTEFCELFPALNTDQIQYLQRIVRLNVYTKRWRIKDLNEGESVFTSDLANESQQIVAQGKTKRIYLHGNGTFRLLRIDPLTGTVKEKMGMDMSFYPILVGDRYAVWQDAPYIYVIDMDAESWEVRRHEFPATPTTPQIDTGSDSAVLDFLEKKSQELMTWRGRLTSCGENLNHFIYAPNAKSGATLLAIDEGALQLVAQLSECNAVVRGVYLDHFFCLSANGKFAEKRSILTGELIHSTPLPKDIAAFEIRGSVLIKKSSELAVFDLSIGEQVRFPNQPYQILDSSEENRFHCIRMFDDDSPSYAVYDANEHRTILNLGHGRKNIEDLWITKDLKLILAQSCLGMRAELFDLKTGTVESIEPFRWASIALPFLMAVFAFWVHGWTRIASQLNWPALMDIILIASLVFGALILRLLAFGRGDIYMRTPHNLLCYLGLGLGQLVALWLVFGRSRLMLRCVTFFAALITGTGLFLLCIVFRSPHYFETTMLWMDIYLMVLFFPVAALSYWALQWNGMRLTRAEGIEVISSVDSGNEDNHCSTDNQRRRKPKIALTDLFLLTLVIALGIIVVRPLLPDTFPDFDFTSTSLVVQCLIAVSLIVIQFAMLNANALLYRGSQIISWTLFSLLIASVTYEFVTHEQMITAAVEPFITRWQLHKWLPYPVEYLFEKVSAAIVGTYLFSLPIRARGYRVCFKRAPNNS